MKAVLNSFKLVCAGVGFVVIVLYALGSVGIGNFVLVYGSKPITCTKG